MGLDSVGDRPQTPLGIEYEISRAYEGKRRQEFCSGRALVHQVLKAMGHSECAIGRTPNGAPDWPRGVAGSLSHSDGLVGVIAGPSDAWFGVGLDIERVGRIDSTLWPLLFTLPEQQFLRDQSESDRAFLSTAFFSFKEAFLKLPSPWPEAVTDYSDIEVRSHHRRFTVHSSSLDLRLHFGRSILTGDLFRHGEFVVSTILLDAYADL